jgi:tetratricopeptide (TPR) repeat protein
MLPSDYFREYTVFHRIMLRTSLLCIVMLSAPYIGAQVHPEGQSVPTAVEGTPSVPSLADAQDLVTRGRLAEAQRELDSLTLQQPEPAGAERLRGFVFYQQNRFSEAEASFAKAVQQNASDLESMQMRGVVLYRMGKSAEAIPLLERARISVPDANIDPEYVLGACYLSVGRYDEARRAFAAQYDFPPDSASAYLITARMLFHHEMTQQADDAARKAVQINPRLPLAHRLLGEIALAKGDYPAAIAELQKERELNPLDGELYNRLGDAFIRQGQYREAQQALDRAILLEPNATGPYILLGKVLLKQQEPVMAVMYLERAVQMDPANYMIHGLLAQAYRIAGRKDEAIRELQMAGKLQSGSGSKTGAPDAQQ